MELTKTLNSLNGLDNLELKALSQEILGRLLSGEMQNGRMSTVDEQLLHVCFSNAEGSYIRVESKKNGNFEMQLERYYITNEKTFGHIEMEFYDYKAMEVLSDEEVDKVEESLLYRCLEIPVLEIERINVHTLTCATITTLDDEITFYVL